MIEARKEQVVSQPEVHQSVQSALNTCSIVGSYYPVGYF
jgi:hypothetical protein